MSDIGYSTTWYMYAEFRVQAFLMHNVNDMLTWIKMWAYACVVEYKLPCNIIFNDMDSYTTACLIFGAVQLGTYLG